MSFVDASDSTGETVLDTDVCIVGAGAAGITLATALAERGRDCTLVESGGFQIETETQHLYDGVSVGTPYALEASRLRTFGGSSNHWGGQCAMLDDDVLAPRSWVPDGAWPLRRAELEPYYRRALAVLDIGMAPRFEDLERDIERYPRMLGEHNGAFAPMLWLRSPPTHLGDKFRNAIKLSPRLRCMLHANVTELIANADGTAITELHARTFGGRTLKFRARDFVLATGGIENARLLLLSDATVRGGIGNAHDLVGRFFSDHPNHPVGRMVVASPAGTAGFQEEYLQHRSLHGLSNVWQRGLGFVSTSAFRREHRLQGVALHAMPLQDDVATTAVGILVRDALGDAPAGDATRAPRSYALGVIAEQAPNPASRITLDDSLDAFGRRRVRVDLRLSDADRRSIDKTVRRFGLELARAGAGRMRLEPIDDARRFTLTGHHMGTTRMADDPRRGVTDRDGRVHGVRNLHVTGSSLFPSGGYVGPTLTIVALALRLADRLASAAVSRAPSLRAQEDT